MFQWDKATISINLDDVTIGDEERFYALITLGQNKDKGTGLSWSYFAQFQAYATVHGEFPVKQVASAQSADFETLVLEQYRAWQNLPRRFLKLWTDESEILVKNEETPSE